MRTLLLSLLLVAISAVGPASLTLAEVAMSNSPDGSLSSLSVIALESGGGGGGDGVDPWPMVRQNIPQEWVLNPLGGENVPADGVPAFAWNGVDQTFEVAWARHDGNDYEIVISRWMMDHWTVPQELTSNAVDDSDPHIAIAPNGVARIVFQDDSQVYVMTRPAGGSWSAPEAVDSGALPSIPGRLLERVAYQRDAGGGVTEIITSYDDGAWTPTVLRTTTFAGLDGSGDLDVRIHTAMGRVWIVWEDGPSELGWSELVSGSWSPVRFEPISAASDEEQGRLRIRQQLSP